MGVREDDRGQVTGVIILVASGLFATVYLLVLQNFGWFAALVVAFLTAPIVSWVITKRIRGG